MVSPVEVEPSQELIAAFNGFLTSKDGYKTIKTEDQPPSAMGGSSSTKYTLENKVVVERLSDPVKRNEVEYIQFTVQLPSGEYHCFFRENV